MDLVELTDDFLQAVRHGEPTSPSRPPRGSSFSRVTVPGDVDRQSTRLLSVHRQYFEKGQGNTVSTTLPLSIDF